MKLPFTFLILFLCSIAVVARAADKLDGAKIEEITGLKGKQFDDERVFKVSKPRDDIAVKVDGWKMPPFMGLTSWVAFSGSDEMAMAMGDTVLLEGEVNAAMSAALD